VTTLKMEEASYSETLVTYTYLNGVIF